MSKRNACAALLMMVATASTGCYSYSTVRRDDLQPGAQVRTRITAVEADRLRESLGREDRDVEGTVLENNSSSLLLAVAHRSTQPGLPAQPLHQRVDLAASEVLEIQVRRLNTPKTAAFVGGITALAAILVVTQFQSDGPGIDGPGKGGTDNARIPIGFRISR